tara:strand:+ start:893 stop:1186 length:294 start_codon:yes stop_codon:yes gene_type:complete
MFNFTVKRFSNSINEINCQLAKGCVLVTFKSGETYSYKNVSKRAIVQLWLDYAFTNENISLGFWVNNNCIRPNRVRYANVKGLVDYYGSTQSYLATV